MALKSKSKGPTVKYDTKTGKKLSTGQSTMVDGKSVKAGSLYTGGNAYGSDSKKVAYSSKTGSMLAPGEKTTYANREVTQGESIDSPENLQAVADLPPQIAPQVPGQAPTPQAVTPAQPGVPTATPQPGQPGAVPSPYQQGLSQTLASGTPAPTTLGQAFSTIKGSLPTPQEDMSATDALLMEDKGWQGLMQMKEEYFNPEKQKVSLMDTYNKLYKKSGLDQLDEEIMDAKTIIEGTEDDIRNEVEMAGGFGTDSQVQALALSRNKVLLKNFNNLVALRESKAEHLGTMMNLAEKDRSYADSQFDRMLNYDMQMLNYRDKFVQNARDQYNKYTPQQLQSMLSGNPRQLAFAEQIMGVGPGGLERLTNAPLSEMDQLDLDYKKGQIELQKSSLLTDKAQRANINSQINERNNPVNETGTLTGKPQNATQAKANGYADRLAQANITLDSLGTKFADKKTSGGGFLPTFLQSKDRQAYEMAKKNFVTAVLRQESGASIAPSEFKDAVSIYFAVPGDKPETVKSKENLRNTVINSFYREANINRPVLPGQVIEGDDGQTYKVGVDGETLEPIN